MTNIILVFVVIVWSYYKFVSKKQATEFAMTDIDKMIFAGQNALIGFIIYRKTKKIKKN